MDSSDYIKIDGYVARDATFVAKDLNGNLKEFTSVNFYTDLPIREDSYWIPENDKGECCDQLSLPCDSFPNLKWEDDPIKTEILIRIK